MAGVAGLRLPQPRGCRGPNSCWRGSASGPCGRACRWPPAPPRPTSTPSPPRHEPPYPGDRELERRIKSIIRWNAMAMVVRANKRSPGIGGHISTFASAATLYEVAFNHFLHGKQGTPAAGPGLLPGPRRAGDLRPGVSAGPAQRAAVDQFPPRAAARRRAVVLSAPLADARLLGVPHGLDGPGADHGHLPGPLQPLPGGPRHQARRRRPRGSGPSWATASATSRRPWGPSPWPPASNSTT